VKSVRRKASSLEQPLTCCLTSHESHFAHDLPAPKYPTYIRDWPPIMHYHLLQYNANRPHIQNNPTNTETQHTPPPSNPTFSNRHWALNRFTHYIHRILTPRILINIIKDTTPETEPRLVYNIRRSPEENIWGRVRHFACLYPCSGMNLAMDHPLSSTTSTCDKLAELSLKFSHFSITAGGHAGFGQC
jgi:hypothetical protein